MSDAMKQVKGELRKQKLLEHARPVRVMADRRQLARGKRVRSSDIVREMQRYMEGSI